MSLGSGLHALTACAAISSIRVNPWPCTFVVFKKKLIVSKERCSCSDKTETISKEGLNKIDSHDLSLYLLLLNTAVVIITVRDKANQTAIRVKWGLNKELKKNNQQWRVRDCELVTGEHKFQAG